MFYAANSIYFKESFICIIHVCVVPFNKNWKYLYPPKKSTHHYFSLQFNKILTAIQHEQKIHIFCRNLLHFFMNPGIGSWKDTWHKAFMLYSGYAVINYLYDPETSDVPWRFLKSSPSSSLTASSRPFWWPASRGKCSELSTGGLTSAR